MRRAACSIRRFARLLAAVGAAGCYDVHTIDPGHPIVPLVADESGWVAADSNPLGLAGAWYSYGDQYPVLPRCTEFGFHPADVGEHEADQCSFVGSPDASQSAQPAGIGYFPNSGNRLCTHGDTAKVTTCQPGAEQWCPDNLPDYPNMWGAGIALDFYLDDGAATAEAGIPPSWDAPAHGVIGVTFDLEWNDPSVEPAPFLRVEFPVVLPPEGLTLAADTVTLEGDIVHAGDSLPLGASSKEHPSGSPFWDAPPLWGTTSNDLSGVVVGHNELFWSDVKGAPSRTGSGYAYAFHPERLLGIQFHVPAIKETRIPYGFCISNLALLRQ